MTIFVDMDEVIANTYQAHIDLYNQEHNGNLSASDCFGKEVWQCVPLEHQDGVKKHAYRLGFFKDLEVIPGSQKVLEELSAKHQVYIASAAMQFPNSLKEKSDWLDEHFPFILWQNRILCGHKHILKGDVLIDDRPYNLKNFDGRPILFSSPHNLEQDDLERADSWEDIATKLL
ncbi:MAG: 5'(3')-deoxyribonucleotidase [Bacteroidota bacterium]